MKGIPTDRFADLYGKSVLLRVGEGYHVPVLPDEPPRGDATGYYGIVAGLGVNLLCSPRRPTSGSERAPPCSDSGVSQVTCQPPST
jgi:hypothetical protein